MVTVTATSHVSIYKTPTGLAGYIGDQHTEQGNSGIAVRDSLYFMGYNVDTLRINGQLNRPVIGGTSPTSLEVVSNWRTAGYHPTLWIIALITNNSGQTLATMKAEINSLLDLIDDETIQKVLWVGPVLGAHADSTTTSQLTTMYQALNEVATARSAIMSVFNISTTLHNGRDETGLWDLGDSTGKTMTSDGYALRNLLIRKYLSDNMPAAPSTTVTATAHVSITAPANTAPTISRDKAIVRAGEIVTLTVGDPGGSVASVEIDGVVPEPAISGSGSTRTFVAPITLYDKDLTVTVRDNEGLTASTTVKVKASPFRVCHEEEWKLCYITVNVP